MQQPSSRKRSRSVPMSRPTNPTRPETLVPATATRAESDNQSDVEFAGEAAAAVDMAGLRTTGIEWPTLAVAFGVYGGIAATVAFHDALGGLATVVLLAFLGGWYLSLQHECLHGHPFASRRWNFALAWIPVNLWLPFAIYRESHLQHHRNALLTEPGVDPESQYLRGDKWDRLEPLRRAVFVANTRLLGRLFIGPTLSIFRRAKAFPSELVSAKYRKVWIAQLLGAAGVAYLVQGVAGLALWKYFLGVGYGGLMVSAIRSYAEHRWVPGDGVRSATVDASWFWRLLFLNNNYHYAHHTRPSVAWYRVPELSRRLDAMTASASGAGCYRGYGEIFRRYLLTPVIPVVHPEHPARCCAAFPNCDCRPSSPLAFS